MGFCHLFLLKALPDRPHPPQMAWCHPIIVSGGCPIHLPFTSCVDAVGHRGWPLSGKASSCWFQLCAHPAQSFAAHGTSTPCPLSSPRLCSRIQPISPVLVLRAVNLPVSHLILVHSTWCRAPSPSDVTALSHLNPYDVHDYTPTPARVTLACT